MKSQFALQETLWRPNFPVLAKENSSKLVVLFTSPCSGWVVHSDHQRPIGQVYDTHHPIDDEQIWTVLPRGSYVTLTQD